jgi:hypothetical protein
MQDFHKAIRDFDDAVRIGTFLNSRYARGWAKLQIGDVASGKEDIAYVKRKDPKISDNFDKYYGIIK